MYKKEEEEEEKKRTKKILGMQVVISLFQASSRKKPLKMRAGRKEHS